MRHDTNWPACGELDILETVNSQLKGYGTAHCDVYPNGIYKEPAGRAGNISVPTQDWQNWHASSGTVPTAAGATSRSLGT